MPRKADKQSVRDKYLRRKYGISLEQYNEMLKQQNFSCALCGKHQSNFSKSLHVEHNHKTGRVRSLCCFYCNRRRIGMLTLEWAKKIYDYLLKYDGAA